MSIEFLLTSLVVALLPGTGVLYTLAVGLGLGMKASMIAAFGCTLGIVWHIASKALSKSPLCNGLRRTDWERIVAEPQPQSA